MRLIGKSILLKLKKKNLGNQKLTEEIDKLISNLENFNPLIQQIHHIRKDADCVHNEGFYFFNLNKHRTLILLEFDDRGDASIIWAGTHQEYEQTFKNNKNTIEKWLRKNNHIE